MNVNIVTLALIPHKMHRKHADFAQKARERVSEKRDLGRQEENTEENQKGEVRGAGVVPQAHLSCRTARVVGICRSSALCLQAVLSRFAIGLITAECAPVLLLNLRRSL